MNRIYKSGDPYRDEISCGIYDNCSFCIPTYCGLYDKNFDYNEFMRMRFVLLKVIGIRGIRRGQSVIADIDDYGEIVKIIKYSDEYLEKEIMIDMVYEKDVFYKICTKDKIKHNTSAWEYPLGFKEFLIKKKKGLDKILIVGNKVKIKWLPFVNDIKEIELCKE